MSKKIESRLRAAEKTKRKRNDVLRVVRVEGGLPGPIRCASANGSTLGAALRRSGRGFCNENYRCCQNCRRKKLSNRWFPLLGQGRHEGAVARCPLSRDRRTWPVPARRWGGGSISSKPACADRPHYHSRIFFCSASISGTIRLIVSRPPTWRPRKSLLHRILTEF